MLACGIADGVLSSIARVGDCFRARSSVERPSTGHFLPFPAVDARSISCRRLRGCFLPLDVVSSSRFHIFTDSTVLAVVFDKGMRQDFINLSRSMGFQPASSVRGLRFDGQLIKIFKVR